MKITLALLHITDDTDGLIMMTEINPALTQQTDFSLSAWYSVGYVDHYGSGPISRSAAPTQFLVISSKRSKCSY